MNIIPASLDDALRSLQRTEIAVSGRSKFEDSKYDVQLSILSLIIAFTSLIFYFYEYMQIEVGGEITRIDRIIYSSITSIFTALAIWITSLVIFKATFFRTKSVALLGITSAVFGAILMENILASLLLELRWDIVWANRSLLGLGPDLTRAMTQEKITPENWRLWPFVAISWILIGAFYGTSDTKSTTFIPSFVGISLLIIAFSTNSDYSNYDVESVRKKLLIITILSLIVFSIIRWFCNKSEEFVVNRIKKILTIIVVFNFFLVIFMMDPPDFLQSIAVSLSSIPIIGPLISPLGQSGVPSTQWGGFFVNFIVASAGCVLGLFIGIIFAFGRQSQLPIVKWPTVLFIEIFRSGPLICWLYFAFFMLGDMADPLFSDPEDFSNIIRMMVIFSLFGGVYIAEVIRGGLQSVDSGQKEAAIALGLSPIQTKQFVELPNAIRTTLPSIVSVFIGLWKDTTLLYIIGVMDFLKIASTMANTDFNFMGYYLEPLYFAAIVFWLPAFYISRISMKVEKSLGLVNDGGAERT